MNEQQYNELCESCDRLLLAPGVSAERIAIPWLHIIREHPVFLDRYADLFHKRKKGFLYAAYTRIHGFLYFLRSVSRSTPWFASDEVETGIDFLFVSHLLNPGQAGNKEDFYFETVPAMLSRQGKKVVIVLINHTGAGAEKLVQKWKGADVPRMILTDHIDAANGFALYRRMLGESKLLRPSAGQPDKSLQHRIASRASREAVAGSTFANLRLLWQLEMLANRLQPANMVVTYEGHAFERMVFAGVRRGHPGVRCIGYQHSGLFRLQHSIRRKLASAYNPDLILTSGETARLQLEKETGLLGIPVDVLGSGRGLEAAGTVGDPAVTACLVLPEGIMSECILLFRFSIECAEQMPDITFIWRLHPSISFDVLVKTDPVFGRLPANVIFSGETLDNDISRSRWVLYRGSTAVIKAAGRGLIPVYYSLQGEMTIDPLYPLGKGRYIVSDSRLFLEKVRSAAGTSDTEGKQEVNAYCRRYFTPINIKALAEPGADINYQR